MIELKDLCKTFNASSGTVVSGYFMTNYQVYAFLAGILGGFSTFLVDLCIAAFGLSFVFQLLTLPVEFNASRRAIRTIEDAQLLTPEEQRGARKTLKAAAMTYVAAMAVALAQLIRLIMIFGNSRRRD